MKKEFGKWVLDIAKYILTAVVITAYFQKFDDEKVLFLTAGCIVLPLLILGLLLQKEDNQTNKNIKKGGKK